MSKKVRILVTGANGFVGSSIVCRLQMVEDYEIFGLVGKKTKIKSRETENFVKTFRADISDYKTLQKLEELKEIDVLIHAAGLAHQFGKTRKEDFWQINVLGTENICRLAEKLKVRQFILISSVSVYGNQGEKKIDETFICKPTGFYAESKFESEKLSAEVCEKNKIGLTILRLGTVIGEGDVGNVARLITQVCNGKFLWVGNGNNKKSLIYKDDVADGVLKLIKAKKNVKTEIFNLTSEAVTMKEIVNAISQNVSKRPLPIKISENLVKGVFRINKKTLSLKILEKIEKTFEKWFSSDIFSGTRIFEDYGFKPRTSFSEAIAKQVKFYLDKEIKKEK